MTDAVDTHVREPLARVEPRVPGLLQLVREDVACVRLRFLDASIAYEMLSINSRDHHEAAKAFLEKRAPSYKGI